jgi:hypothetical protein
MEPSPKPSARPTRDDPGVNPFQVYPVRGLSELSDVRSATIHTPEIAQVEGLVREFAKQFDEPSDPPPRLLLAAKGDFGTGKTHLMLYARDTLISEMATIEKNQKEELRQQIYVLKVREQPAQKVEELEQKAAQLIRTPFVTMTVATEAAVEDWYASELGPALIEITSPRELVRELLTRVACEVAEADRDPDTQELAIEFRKSRKALYQIFRDPGAFDVSQVEERFRAEIDRLCPRTSRSFRRSIEALRWEETSELVEDWLAGNELSSADAARIGVRLEGERSARAANAICAIASLCRRLGRPFALFLDEFEHLTRHDNRNGSKRNITWVKRLVESLARRGALVFISGHWDAWAQQDDFLDRFIGGRPIQLVRLNADDVMSVVKVRAGEDAWPGFTANAARLVVEATSGNIRRVMTVLYDLWGTDRVKRTEVIRDDDVRLAAQHRLQPGSESGIMPAIEAAVRAAGAVLSRNESFGDPPEAVDAVARLDDDLRLIVQIIHARDELALISQGERFARLVKEVRTAAPQARGLCVTLGAVIEKHVLTLDAAFPETDLINGEEPGVVERLPEIIEGALVRAPVSLPLPALESISKLEQVRVGAVGRADAQIARSQQIFGGDMRSEAVREMSVADSDDLAAQKAEIARQEMYQFLMNDAREGLRGAIVHALLNSPGTIALILTGLILCVVGKFISDQRPDNAPSDIVGQHAFSSTLDTLVSLWWLVPMSYLMGAMLIISGLVSCGRLFFDVLEFRRFRIQTLQRFYTDGAPSHEFSKINDVFEEALLRYGPRNARRFAMSEIAQHRSGAAGPPPPWMPPPSNPPNAAPASA